MAQTSRTVKMLGKVKRNEFLAVLVWFALRKRKERKKLQPLRINNEVSAIGIVVLKGQDVGQSNVANINQLSEEIKVASVRQIVE